MELLAAVVVVFGGVPVVVVVNPALLLLLLVLLLLLLFSIVFINGFICVVPVMFMSRYGNYGNKCGAVYWWCCMFFCK